MLDKMEDLKKGIPKNGKPVKTQEQTTEQSTEPIQEEKKP